MEIAKKSNNAPYSTPQRHTKSRSGTVTLLPALEQSTRISSSRNVTGIDKRIPKNILTELHNQSDQNESNFFMTQYGQSQIIKKAVMRKSSTQQDVRVKKPKEKLEVIMGEVRPNCRLDTAINKLRNLRQIKPNKKKNRSNESSFDEKEKSEIHLVSQIESVKNGRSVHQLQSESLTRLYFQNKAEQVKVMQNNLVDGLSKFNNVKEKIKERERKMQELQRQLLKLIEEDELIQSMKGEENENAGFYKKEIEYYKEQMQSIQMEKNILSSMKDTRKRDLEIISAPYLRDKDILQNITEFLNKETENLVQDAKVIDQIRVRLVDQRQEKKKLESQSVLLKKDQEIHQKNCNELERAIEEEVEFNKFQQDLARQLRYDQEMQIEEKKRIRFEEEKAQAAKLEQLQSQFGEIASLVPTLKKESDVLDSFVDIRNTNQFLKDKREATIQQMKDTREDIAQMKEMLLKLKSNSCNVQENDKIQVEMEQIAQKGFANKLKDEIFLLALAKQKATRLSKLQIDLKKGFMGIQEEFEFNQLAKIQENAGQMSVIEMGTQLMQMIKDLVQKINKLDMSSEEQQALIKVKQTKLSKRRYQKVPEDKASIRFSEKEMHDEEHSDSSY